MNTEIIKVIEESEEREFNPQETLQVLKHNIYIFWSWGVSKMYNHKNKVLILKVSGHHHKGYVLISLGWDDTYTVRIITTHGKVLNTYTGIYFDQLTEIIDNRIERIPDYVK